MTHGVSVADLIRIHDSLILASGGSFGLRDRGALESATAQPMMSFGGADLYRDISEKAAALGFSLNSNHLFVDGNKRIGQAAMEAFLLRNGKMIVTPVNEQESVIRVVAASEMDRAGFARWLAGVVQPLINE